MYMIATKTKLAVPSKTKNMMNIVTVFRSGHWLVVLWFNATSTVKVMRCTCVLYWLSHNSTDTTSFPKPPATFLTCFSRGERRKYTEKKVRLNQISNSQPPGQTCSPLSHSGRA